jgi:glutamine amidotransferase
MGWNEIKIEKKSKLFEGMEEQENRFYFVHSYHLVCDAGEDILVSTHYGYDFTCGVERNNILGVQFHPEKSHKFGMQLLRNFSENY